MSFKRPKEDLSLSQTHTLVILQDITFLTTALPCKLILVLLLISQAFM